MKLPMILPRNALIRQCAENGGVGHKDRSSFSGSSITNPMKMSTLRPRETRVIITLEASGEFLGNVLKVCSATGLSIEELFSYLSNALDAYRADQFPPALLMNDRLPRAEQVDVQATLGNLIEQYTAETEQLVKLIGVPRLVEVHGDDDIAVVEVSKPEPEPLPSPDRIVHPRRRRLVKHDR